MSILTYSSSEIDPCELAGTLFQIGALPIVVLGPLGAVSLLWNAAFARLVLGDEFTVHLIVGEFCSRQLLPPPS